MRLQVAITKLLAVIVCVMSLQRPSEAHVRPRFTTLLNYPSIRSSNASAAFRVNGRVYRFRFEPFRDIDGSALTLILVLERVGANAEDRNFLDPGLHGSQKWDYIARDFALDARRSTKPREMRAYGLDIAVRATVVKSHVVHAADSSAADPGYRFTALTIRIEVDADASLERRAGLGTEKLEECSHTVRTGVARWIPKPWR